MPPSSPARKKSAAGESASQAFAAMSRAAIGAPRKAPAKKAVAKKAAGKKAATARGAARVAAPPVSPALVRATAKAIGLGAKQAEWVIERRGAALATRARAVARAAKPAPELHVVGGRKAPAKKAVAKKATAARTATAVRAGTSRGVLVAEGDSWFDYPFHDVLKELDDSFGWEIEHVAHYGHTVESMAYDGGQLDDFVRAIEKVARRGETPRAILLSGGGNDVAGEGFGMLVNHRSSPVHGLEPKVLEGIVETRVRTAYATILAAVTTACEALVGAKVPILLHGYDYPVPDGRGLLGGWGPLPGPWLQPGFAEKGYDDLAERIGLTRELIDRLYAMLASVVALPPFAHVKLVDLRESLSTELANNRYKAWWGNELHPTHQGFTKVAGLFDAAIGP